MLAAFAAFLVTALPLEAPPVLIWSLLGVSLGAIWFPALARFFGIIALILVAAILFGFVGQGLEVRQTDRRQKIFAASPRVRALKSTKSLIGSSENIVAMSICILRSGCRRG